MHHKFGITLDPRNRKLEPEAFKELVREKAAAAYRRERNRIPGDGRAVHFTLRDDTGQKRFDREKLVGWARASTSIWTSKT